MLAKRGPISTTDPLFNQSIHSSTDGVPPCGREQPSRWKRSRCGDGAAGSGSRDEHMPRGWSMLVCSCTGITGAMMCTKTIMMPYHTSRDLTMIYYCCCTSCFYIKHGRCFSMHCCCCRPVECGVDGERSSLIGSPEALLELNMTVQQPLLL